jgi:lipopolysaccharide/colanic/teichoic acid biosynthesis glycosyltransferase
MLIKRLFDVAASLLGVVVLTPILVAVACWIKWDSSGPVFFRQQRVGRYGIPFAILKFRTMATDAESRGQLTVGKDARITRAGVFLRHYRIDELPQLFNVLVGQMSLVGPRPEVPRYVACYPPALRDIVLSVRPGITDWAAIQYKDESALLNGASQPERTYIETILPAKLEYYVQYVRCRSFLTDLRIIFATLYALVR